MKGKVKTLEYQQALDFLLPKHYSGRVPSISKAFGWFIKDELVAVVSYGKPASNFLCTGLMGKEFASNVYELNRLCRVDHLEDQLSGFVSATLRRLKSENWIVVSYSDTGMKHCGYIYQACNFIYTGATKRRTDPFIEGGKHARHIDCKPNGLRQVRTAKHRYVFFCASSKRTRRNWLKNLKYPIEEYPKGENGNYEVGFVQTPEIIDKRIDYSLL